MIKYISKTKAIKARLNNGIVVYLDDPAHIMANEEMNKELETFRREYRLKDKITNESAARTFLQ